MWGIILIGLGVIFGANALGLAKIDIFFEGWWTLFIIIPSVISLLEGNDVKTSLICLIVGILLLLSARGIIDFAIVGRLIFPIILIIFGLMLILKRNKTNDFAKIEMDKDSDEIAATFGEQNIKIDEEFKGKTLNAAFGKIVLNLSEAKIKKDVKIKAEAVFGSIEIIVPEGVQVKTKNTAIFGSVANNCSNNDGNKTIYVEATSVFGGIAINEYRTKNN